VSRKREREKSRRELFGGREISPGNMSSFDTTDRFLQMKSYVALVCSLSGVPTGSYK